MALELKQHLKMAQQLVMTPQLQQAIKLLQLSRLELNDYIAEELESNPLLEADPPASAEKDARAEESSEQLKSRWESYLETYGQDNIPYYEDDERPPLEATTSKKEGLYEHLLWQIRMSALDESERALAIFIIGNLDNNGYFTMDKEAVMAATGADRPAIEKVLAQIQTFDPPGIAARDLKDCLFIQARNLDLDGTMVWYIIAEHLEALQTKNYDKIARDLDASVDDVACAAEIIVNMEPRPARDFTDEPPQYVVPDVYVVNLDGEFVVVLNEEDIPMLNISREYRSMMKASDTGKMARDYLTERLKSAQWLIKSIQQRQNTMIKVSESIVKFQHSFLEKGISHLKPLVLRDVADDVGMHESTISRVTSNKYMHTPQGTFELKFFFNSGISMDDGSFVASQTVKNEIENLVKNEDRRKPLSDQAISLALKDKGINIARRTVAKYRELLGILPSSQRKKHY